MTIIRNWKLRLVTSIIFGLGIVRLTLYQLREAPISFGEITVVIFFLIVVAIVFGLASLINYLTIKYMH